MGGLVQGCTTVEGGPDEGAPERDRRSTSLEYIADFFSVAAGLCVGLDYKKIDAMVEEIELVRQNGGRVFVLGIGGSAANASHAVSDLRKMCGVQAYAPTDNISEILARINDEEDGWSHWMMEWLDTNNIGSQDVLLILSVGGGTRDVSHCLVEAIEYAKPVGARVLGIVGSVFGHTAMAGDVVLVIPKRRDDLITPMAESFQELVWHCIVNNPRLKQ